ncbi:GGDEF domain-containing protein [Qipengyuania gelatinilytica]|uniref:diguanylate cyclase n=1 Tax=Qipengyuania gelatinilytica TaxID=2867231 RepID=A0ABX9A1J6_9SPHN|nr:GGDEF domain-containing protein [Qipengyuania gelatinilytica]QZD95004.1 GGDEF domain-containing protein [Qipengyuania gelatinilytica]
MRASSGSAFDFVAVLAWAIPLVLAACAVLIPGEIEYPVLLLASLAALTALSYRHLRLRRALAREAEGLSRSVEALEAAEGLAGIGRWCIELEPRRHLWSEEMCRLAGLEPGTAPTRQTLLKIMPDGLHQLETTLCAHGADRESYAVEFELEHGSSGCRVLRARAQNSFSPEGQREQVFMVVRDVTEEYSLHQDRERAIERAKQAERQANTDPLTGIANRRAIMGELDRRIIWARDTGEPLSIIVFDIDHFKTVNDRHGHITGDRVIAEVAKIASGQTREDDEVGRIGGEEFLWIMPGCDGPSALRAAERLRWAIEAGTHGAPLPPVTISAGHAEMRNGDSALVLFARADEALYEAKRKGRNRVSQAA